MLRARYVLAITLSASVAAVPAVAEEWFDAYARGLRALEQGDGAKAAELLERAVRKRPEPGVQVLTYGTNRLDRYYPYLHLARAYVKAGRPEAAEEALQRSRARAREPADERDRLAALVQAKIDERRSAARPPQTEITATPAATEAPAAPPTSTPVASAPMVTATATQVAGIAPTRAAVGTLEVVSDPAGASVLIGTRLAGVTPLVVDMPPGDYHVTLRREGTAELQFAVRVQAGRRTIEQRKLVTTATPAMPAPAATATLVIVTQPPSVSVYVDDVPLGTTDPTTGRLVKSGLEPGPHRVRLSRSGYVDVVEDVTVAPDGPTGFRRTLDAASGARSSAAVAGATALVLIVAGTLAWRLRRRSHGDAAPSASVGTGVQAATPSHGHPASVATAVSPPTASAGGETQAITAPTHTRVSAAQSQFGEYRLLEPLGKGGMASVFKAERRGQICALKRPLGSLLDDPEFRQRFLREAEIGRTLHHHNIIRIHDRGEIDGVPYFTMELVEGETLADRLRREGAMDPVTAVRLVTQVAEALDYAHLKGVVHRDLKPSNIMILRDGTVKVMDYGIARARRFDGLTVTGAFLGTPDYVAPETAEGLSADARSDLYSLGIVFYELLTARRPFSADTPFATIKKHCLEPPPRPSSINAAVPAELEAIILRLLSKSPDARHAGAEDLLIELRDFLNRAA